MADETGGSMWDVAGVVSVTDGDTLRLIRSRRVVLDGRAYHVIDDAKGVAVRLVWVDTPERGDHPGWENARADLTAWLHGHAGPFRVYCYDTSAGWDRLLGDLIDADGNSASQWLMTEGNGGVGWPPYVKG
jgi:endonuclease YncB( thermonuclease family)